MKNRIFTLIALLIFAASMLSCAAARPEKPSQTGSATPVAVTGSATKSEKKPADSSKKSSNTKTKNPSPAPPFTAPTIKEETIEPDPETMSADCIALREYAEKMLELHPFYNEAKKESALKYIYSTIPYNLDYMQQAEMMVDNMMLDGLHLCPYCCEGRLDIEIKHIEDDGVRVGEMTNFVASESLCYPDKGDKATATCPKCKKSFDAMDYCIGCRTVGHVKTVCIGETDSYGGDGNAIQTFTSNPEVGKYACVWGWCQNCDASFRYQNCVHKCGGDCPYESHTREELKERKRAFIQKRNELSIADRIFSGNYFVQGIQ